MTGKLKADKAVNSGHFSDEEKVPHVGLLKRETQYRDLVTTKIAKGLEDIATGRTVSREEFLAEIKERRLNRI
jgi:predicted transcriptional regulator